MMRNNTLVRWDITKKCNLSCKHCINGNKYSNITEASSDEKRVIIRNLAEGGVSRLHLLGGEATVIEDIEDIVCYATQNGIKVSLNTNSIVMAQSHTLCQTLARCGVDVSFSIDGSTATMHEGIRGKGTFEHIMIACKRYFELTKNEGIVRAFYYTLTPDNKDDSFERLFALADDLGINNIVIGVMIPLGNGKHNYKEGSLSEKEILDISCKIIKIANGYPEINLSFPFQTPLFLKYMEKLTGQELGLCYSKCKSGICEFSLEPDGTLYPCIYINEHCDESGSCKREYNSIIHNRFRDTINNSFFKMVQKKLNDSEILDGIEPCNRCPYNKTLGICRPCAYQHMVATDDFHKNRMCSEILDKTNGSYLERRTSENL